MENSPIVDAWFEREPRIKPKQIGRDAIGAQHGRQPDVRDQISLVGVNREHLLPLCKLPVRPLQFLDRRCAQAGYLDTDLVCVCRVRNPANGILLRRCGAGTLMLRRVRHSLEKDQRLDQEVRHNERAGQRLTVSTPPHGNGSDSRFSEPPSARRTTRACWGSRRSSCSTPVQFSMVWYGKPFFPETGAAMLSAFSI